MKRIRAEIYSWMPYYVSIQCLMGCFNLNMMLTKKHFISWKSCMSAFVPVTDNYKLILSKVFTILHEGKTQISNIYCSCLNFLEFFMCSRENSYLFTSFVNEFRSLTVYLADAKNLGFQLLMWQKLFVCFHL